MANIKLVDAAKHYRGLPHQIAAWNALQAHVPITALQEFQDTYRAAPELKVGLFTPGTDFSYRITPNVTYGELALQSEARRFHKQHQCDTAAILCQWVQKARDHFGRPAIITSGYRPPKINAQVGGASMSEHLYSAPDTGAVDFYLDGMSVRELQLWLDKQYPYSLGYGAPKGFVHLGMRPGRPRIRWNY